MASKKAQYEKPASQVDLEERLENGNRSDRVLSTSDEYVGNDVEEETTRYAVEDNDLSNYVGVSPEYATYANETEAPLGSDDDDNPEAQVFEEFVASPLPGTLKVKGNVEHEGAKEAAEAARKASEDARAAKDESEETDTEPETAPGGNPDSSSSNNS